MIQPLFNATDDQWVTMVGRYILNMGAAEAATRRLILIVHGNESASIFRDDLAARIGFLRKRFPRHDSARHQWAMKVFELASQHTTFRNIVAHSPIAMTGNGDGTFHIQGIMDLTPKDKSIVAQFVSLEELKGRVNESAALSRQLLDMQNDFLASMANLAVEKDSK